MFPGNISKLKTHLLGGRHSALGSCHGYILCYKYSMCLFCYLLISDTGQDNKSPSSVEQTTGISGMSGVLHMFSLLGWEALSLKATSGIRVAQFNVHFCNMFAMSCLCICMGNFHNVGTKE